MLIPTAYSGLAKTTNDKHLERPKTTLVTGLTFYSEREDTCCVARGCSLCGISQDGWRGKKRRLI